MGFELAVSRGARKPEDLDAGAVHAAQALGDRERMVSGGLVLFEAGGDPASSIRRDGQLGAGVETRDGLFSTTDRAVPARLGPRATHVPGKPAPQAGATGEQRDHLVEACDLARLELPEALMELSSELRDVVRSLDDLVRRDEL